MNVYDYYGEQKKRSHKGQIASGLFIAVILAILVTATNIYMQIIQLNEIGNFSGIFTKNLLYQVVFFLISFFIIFIAVTAANIVLKRNIKKYLQDNNLEQRKLPNFLLSFVAGLAGAFLSRGFFYQKALTFLNASSFGKTDPIFNQDIGYYVFQRPFLMSVYEFISSVWLFIIIYTILYYLAVFFTIFNGTFTIQDLKVKSIIRHNLVNLAVFFIIKAFSYKFQREGILYSSVVNVTGASYVDHKIWLAYFTAAPLLLTVIVALAFMFIWRGRLKQAAYSIAIYPAVWVIVAIISTVVHSFIVKPNEINLESPYLKNNMQKTREAYKIDNIKNKQFSAIQDLTPEIIKRNAATKDNIRIVDYQATLDSNIQLQSNTNFYSFHNGDIVNYTINGKEIPVFITAREIDKSRLPAQSRTYVNNTFKYTHGYGVVVNPINRLASGGQVDFIINGLKMDSIDKNIKILEPRIYFGELTRDHVIVGAGNNLDEIDYDGNTSTRYTGKGGIKLGLLNRLLFALKYGDLNMVISGYVSSDSKLLLNRQIISRAKMALPFLNIDDDPYILFTGDGRLKWVVDAYTTTGNYPYSQYHGAFNYIRNSVKIVVDAYDGSINAYIIDPTDPIINTYKKMFPDAFTEGPLPADVAAHMRYPEFLYKVQTDMLKRYHLDPNGDTQNVSMFYSQQDLWDIAKYPHGDGPAGARNADAAEVRDIDPYYTMIKLPEGIGTKEELILMRPFTPSNKNNMVSWLSVRNSNENYGEMILFTFPKNTNILGPYQIEVNINQIDKISKDMSLWNQSGSRVFKGSLLVVPIENSVLYVEPIYIQAAGTSSIPQVREIVVGFQRGEEFKYGIGANMDEALNDLFAGQIKTAEPAPKPAPGQTANEKLLNDITAKYDALRKQLDELGSLINELRK